MFILFSFSESLYKRSSERQAAVPEVTLGPMEIRTFHATVNEFNRNYQR